MFLESGDCCVDGLFGAPLREGKTSVDDVMRERPLLQTAGKQAKGTDMGPERGFVFAFEAEQ